MQSAWDSSLCMQVVGGGSLVACDGSRSRIGRWRARRAGRSWCRVRVSLPVERAAGGGPPTRLSFDDGVGLEEGERDGSLSGESTAVTTVSASLPQGDGISQIFRLQKLS